MWRAGRESGFWCRVSQIHFCHSTGIEELKNRSQLGFEVCRRKSGHRWSWQTAHFTEEAGQTKPLFFFWGQKIWSEKEKLLVQESYPLLLGNMQCRVKKSVPKATKLSMWINKCFKSSLQEANQCVFKGQKASHASTEFRSIFSLFFCGKSFLSVSWMSLAPATCGLLLHFPGQPGLKCSQFLEGNNDPSSIFLLIPNCLDFFYSLPRIIHGVNSSQVMWKPWGGGCAENVPPNVNFPKAEHIFPESHLEAWAQDPGHDGWFVAVPGFRTIEHYSLCRRTPIHLPSQPQCVEIYTALPSVFRHGQEHFYLTLTCKLLQWEDNEL